MPRSRVGKFFTTDRQRCARNGSRGVVRPHVVEGCRGEAFEVEEPEPGVMRTQDRPQTGWEDLDDVCLRRVFECRFRVVQGCPAFHKGRFRHAVRVAFEKRQQAVAAGDATGEVRAWRFLLLPFMLLVAQLARDESGRRSCRPELTSFRTVSGVSSHVKLSGQLRARDHGCQDRKLLRREAKQLVRKSAWEKCPEPDNISRERPSLQGTTRLYRNFDEGVTRRWFDLCHRKCWSLIQRDQ